MCAEEMTNQVLFMRNVLAGDKDMWMTFEAMEDGQLGETHLSTCLFLSDTPGHVCSHSAACGFRAAVTPQREGSGASAAVVQDGRPKLSLPGGEESS